MTLTPEQKQTVASWVAAGDNLSTVQKKLADQLKVSLTYRDVRFLVDDLNLELKDPAPKIDTSDVTKAAPLPAKTSAATERKGKNQEPLDAEASGEPSVDGEDGGADEFVEDELGEAAPQGNVAVAVDKVTLIPGALASGTATFSDGVTAKWIVDQYGRPGFTEVSQPGYRPSAADAQAFMQELSRTLQQRGF